LLLRVMISSSESGRRLMDFFTFSPPSTVDEHL